MAGRVWQIRGRQWLTLGFILLVCTLLLLMARHLDWSQVQRSIEGYGSQTLLLGLALALLSYALVSGYDLIARRYTGHSLPIRHVLPVAFVCYAFNLNFTTWVGGIALRLRLYKRLGLTTGTVTQIITLGIVTNWIGYAALAGLVFSMRLVKLPDSWSLGMLGLQLIGLALVAIAVGYLLACGLAKRRTWAWRRYEITLPSLRLALFQMGLGTSNWVVMASLMFLLLPASLSYPTVLGVLLISCLAGVIAHIPAGLGVLEAVFLALLHDHIEQGPLVAALLGYRTLYYLTPLLLAVISYLILEKRAKSMRQSTP
ncbi:lysylphosphatidylglycerol synthase domain-containing protein [Pseudomonas vanderleydeniana]|uniref:Flippase-like domain-containing protein n=1 Tax=Pseudomonas vanderleydeniana TaxID=2745495 RepID=A0A9E6PGQ4_9PSED|nr:lysylphosphatidylglycerol synthase domain-containing protein [Pseudomonas vanderleydeniana]QXI26344.1 flippase-like domain-containing protein [Pseudomonas vanderleydeniana]